MIKKQFSEGIYNITEHDDGSVEKVINPNLIESTPKSEEELQKEKEFELMADCIELTNVQKQNLSIETTLNYISLLLEHLVQNS